MYDLDIVPFHGLSGLVGLVVGLLGEVPLRPILLARLGLSC